MKDQRMKRVFAFALVLATAAICPAQAQNGAAGGSAPPPKTVAGTAVVVSKVQFNTLRWLEGTWRGTGGGVPAFAEGYHFVNDTTIAISYYSDSTATKVSTTGTMVLSAGQLFYTGNGTEYIATKIVPKTVTFVPKGTNGKNSFEWTMVTPTHWTAVLKGGTGEVTPPTVTYQMVKIK